MAEGGWTRHSLLSFSSSNIFSAALRRIGRSSLITFQTISKSTPKYSCDSRFRKSFMSCHSTSGRLFLNDSGSLPTASPIISNSLITEDLFQTYRIWPSTFFLTAGFNECSNPRSTFRESSFSKNLFSCKKLWRFFLSFSKSTTRSMSLVL